MEHPEIIARLKQGDRKAFAEIVEQCQHMVYNTALGIVQHEEDAEDITQNVFVTLYEKISSFREESALSTWLYRITVRKALDHEKRKQREKHGGLLKRIFSVRESDEPAHFDHPGIMLDKKEQAAILLRAIKKLPEKQRVAFTLHKMEGLSYQQIADIMENSQFATESLLVRAKNNLRNILKEYYEQQFK